MNQEALHFPPGKTLECRSLICPLEYLESVIEDEKSENAWKFENGYNTDYWSNWEFLKQLSSLVFQSPKKFTILQTMYIEQYTRQN